MMAWKLPLKRTAALLIVTISVSGMAQPAPRMTERAEAVARKVAALPPHAKISVIPLHGREEFGRLVSSDEEGFTFDDVDLKINVTMKYVDVRKVKKGYGGVGISGHTDRRKALIVTLCLVGLIGGVIAAAASASD